ncbi:restriction endonuclease subunit S [Acinetobacter junii]|uniref:restriction endonuclease subunit S n=2 Tax=Acinetobacter TaxID=469 RepID=UPI003AA9C4AB
MAKYQKYAEYKDSGVEWLGEIPSHWNLYSLKRSVDKCTNGFWGNEPDGRNDLCVLRVADFNRDNFTINEDKLTLRSVLPKEAESRLIKKGDLLIEKSGGGEKTLVGCVVQFDKDFPAITSNFVAKMTPNVITDSKYLTYAFAHLYSGRVNFPSIKQTTGIQNLDSEAYLMEKFGFPSKNEQIQIANFLDHETTKIDHLIEKQQQLIELLKEKRQAVISHAVTKGLDSNVPMKDSGVEWLGEVPEHWKIIKGGYIGTLFGSESIQEDDVTDQGSLPFIKVSSLSAETFKLSNIDWFVSERRAKFCKAEKNYIVFPKRGAAIFTNKVNVIEVDSVIDPNLMGWKIGKQGITEYFALLLKTRGLDDIADVSTVPQINNKHIAPEKFPLPALSEQCEIVKFVGMELTKFDEMILKAESAIQLMQERRTALISAAVTGKIDVRNWQAPTDAEAQTELSA